MRITVFSLLLTLLFGLNLSLQAQSDDHWENFTSVNGLFKVRTPGPMKHKADTVSTRIGTLVYHTYFYQEELEEGADNFIYMVSYVDYPSTAVHSDSTELISEFFEVTMDQAAFSIAGEVIYNNPIKVEGYPGYIWRINYKEDTGVIKTKAVLANNRYYSIQAVTVKELALNAAIDRFLDSFQLLHSK
ncbi:MAG TPA: hypothetical protein VJ953_09115 [Saprospiraceae bacterium]|nr:hypothetical protein [Saprospiraceae bacterium]